MPRENFKQHIAASYARQMAKSLGSAAESDIPAESKPCQMAVNEDATEATIEIYGDICEWAFTEWGEMDAPTLSAMLADLPPTVGTLNVRINSYGGSVKEGVAIYNILRAHPAKVVTYCDAMACSIASVIFMAGDERVMSHASELMIHNAWTYALGNSEQLRKTADDLDKHNALSVAAYLSRVSITEKDLRALMDAETWLTPEESVSMGFATAIEDYEGGADAQASVKPAAQSEQQIAAPMAAAPDEAEEQPEDGQDEISEGEKKSPEDKAADAAHRLAAFLLRI